MVAKALITILGCAVLLAILAIPLLLRKVPRNVVYGFRTRATLSDDFVWYEVNAHFGRGLLLASLVTAAGIVALSRIPDLSPPVFLKLSVVTLVAPLVAASLLSLRFSRSLTPLDPDRRFLSKP